MDRIERKQQYTVLFATNKLLETADFVVFNHCTETIEYMGSKELKSNLRYVLNIGLDGLNKLNFTKHSFFAFRTYEDYDFDSDKIVFKRDGIIAEQDVEELYGEKIHTFTFYNVKKLYSPVYYTIVEKDVYNVKLRESKKSFYSLKANYKTRTFYNSTLLTIDMLDNKLVVKLYPMYGNITNKYEYLDQLTHKRNYLVVNNDETINKRLDAIRVKSKILGVDEETLIYYKNDNNSVVLIYGSLLYLKYINKIGYNLTSDILDYMIENTGSDIKIALTKEQLNSMKYNLHLKDKMNLYGYYVNSQSEDLDNLIKIGKITII